MAAARISTPTLMHKAADLERWFTFDDRGQVLTYLDVHPHLVPLLVDAVAQFKRLFPQEDKFSLQLIDDPETQVKQLYAIVCTTLSPDEAEARLGRLDEEWWFDAVERAGGDLTIDAEPR